MDVIGFNPHKLDTLLALDEEEASNAVPPLPESPVSRTGDLWQLGPHRVIWGDATSPEVVARLLGDRRVPASSSNHFPISVTSIAKSGPKLDPPPRLQLAAPPRSTMAAGSSSTGCENAFPEYRNNDADNRSFVAVISWECSSFCQPAIAQLPMIRQRTDGSSRMMVWKRDAFDCGEAATQAE